jgi:hypothetical protein
VQFEVDRPAVAPYVPAAQSPSHVAVVRTDVESP